MARKFNRGAIVHLEFDPAAGTEMKGDHFALVVSPNDFHGVGLHIVCPISGGSSEKARVAGYLVSLMGCGTKTDGNVHVHQVKAMDLDVRQAKFIEYVPDYLLKEVTDKLDGLFCD